VHWTSLWPWIAFTGLILFLLAVDLGVFNRKAHAIRPREAAIWSVVWVVLALAFNGLIYLWHGRTAAVEFLAGYLIERSLSIDNIFVFVLIFSYFRVPAEYQHRVLYWGILGALVLRGLLIGVGAALLARFQWIEYLFGAFLVVAAIRMAREGEPDLDLEGNRVVKTFRHFFPVAGEYHGTRFFIRQAGHLVATPLMIVLLLVETTDVVFAFDSIPAIFGVTHDPFIVFSSNIFAILGLRALYFLLAGVMDMFEYLGIGLSAVLIFIGLKMLLSHFVHISTEVSLLVVFAILTVAVIASLLKRRRS